MFFFTFLSRLKSKFLTTKACASTSPMCLAITYKNIIEKLDIEGKSNIKMTDIACKSY